MSDQAKVLYHGTKAEYVEGLRTEGMRVNTNVNPHQWPMLTTSRQQAARYSTDGTVVEYHVPAEAVQSHLGAEQVHTAYGQDAKAHGVLKPLPGEWIKQVHQ